MILLFLVLVGVESVPVPPPQSGNGSSNNGTRPVGDAPAPVALPERFGSLSPEAKAAVQNEWGFNLDDRKQRLENLYKSETAPPVSFMTVAPSPSLEQLVKYLLIGVNIEFLGYHPNPDHETQSIRAGKCLRCE